MKRKYIVAIAAVGMLGLGLSKAQAGTNADETITVTPIATVDLSLSPSTYPYGSLDVNTSSISLPVTLTNSGQTSAKVNKQAGTVTGNWVFDSTTSTAGHFALYVATSSVNPSYAQLAMANHLIGGAANKLQGAGATSDALISAGGGTAALYFLLDTPQLVVDQTAQSIVVRFLGLAQ